jgi:hypothetical protein
MSAHCGWIVAGFVAAWSWAGPALGGEAAATRPARLYTIEQFMDTTSLRGDSFSADETRVLFSSDQTGIFNAYTVPVAGGDPTPVTRSTVESTFSVAFFP